VLEGLKVRVHGALLRLNATLRHSARFAERRMPLLGAVAVASFPLFYLIWGYVFPQPYENLGWRLVVAALSLPLLLAGYLPPRLRDLLPLYWLPCIIVSLPLFTTYMMLMNGMTTVWVMTQLTSTFLVFLLFEVRVSIYALLIGWFLAGLCWFLGGHPDVPMHPLGPLFMVWAFAFITAIVCNLSRSIAEHSRGDSLRATSATIAHEMRTPLASIRLAGTGLAKHLPELLGGYEAAVKAGLIKPKMRSSTFGVIRDMADTVANEAEHAMVTIEMLLAAAQFAERGKDTEVDAGATVEAALNRYPYGSATERDRVRVAVKDTFVFTGSAPALTNVIFNLVKNALHYTARKQEALVHIQVDRPNAGVGRITIFDTGQGISPELLPRIFHRFVSGKERPETALGIGLAYCQEAVAQMGGQIKCSSKSGIFTRFDITFPTSNKADTGAP